MNQKPAQVTVILPTYNRSWGLRPAVQSALAQTYPHFEILIIDDASTDDTQTVARSFTDARVRYYRQPHNVGGIRNYFDGLRRAQTSYVCFLPDDDFLFPTFLENHIHLLEEHPDALMVFSGWRNVRLVDGTFVDDFQPHCRNGHLYDGTELLKIVLIEARATFSAMLYRRQEIVTLWEGIERYDLVNDLVLITRLALQPHARFVYCGTIGFVSCLHPDQATNTHFEELYLDSEKLYLNELSHTSGEQLRTCRRWYEGLLLEGSYVFADRRRWLSLYWLLKSISLRPMGWGLWWRRLYILSVIAGIKKKPESERKSL